MLSFLPLSFYVCSTFCCRLADAKFIMRFQTFFQRLTNSYVQMLDFRTRPCNRLKIQISLLARLQNCRPSMYLNSKVFLIKFEDEVAIQHNEISSNNCLIMEWIAFNYEIRDEDEINHKTGRSLLVFLMKRLNKDNKKGIFL